MKILKVRSLLIAAVVLCSLITVAKFTQKPQLSLSSVSVTLSNSRLSFRGRLGAGNTTGSTAVTINTTAGTQPFTSTSAGQLVQGDSALIGAGATMGTYTVASTSANNLIYTTAGLGASNITAGQDVISSISGTLVVRFTTTNALQAGYFRVLVPSDSNAAASTDGIPDSGVFDGGFNNSAPNIAATMSCPTSIANFTFGTPVATRAATTIGSTTYHSFECAYTGAGAVSTALTATISGLINPSPLLTHTQGVADTPKIVVQHLNNQFQNVDQTTVAIGLIEAVKVTASVAPQITFKIIGVTSGTSSVCDNAAQTTTVTTSPLIVPLGELLIGTFTFAAQTLSVSTNAANGYAVTAKENDQLGRNGATCTGAATADTNCIPDSPGDTATMTFTTPDKWNITTTKGFAFTMHDNNSIAAMSFPFTQATTTGGCSAAAGSCYKKFADNEQSQAPQTIFSAAAPADNHNALVCYKAIIGTTQAAGEYESFITYTATATF